MAIATHCNSSPPGVAPVVVGFHYEAHNAPETANRNSAISADA